MMFALLPAAGQSVRMGRPKLLLRLGGRCVVEHAIEALRCAGIERILVIAAPEPPNLAETAENAGATVLRLERPTAHMRETVQLGLDWIAVHWQPHEEDDWLLCPADHPTLEPQVVEALRVARGHSPYASILVPTFEAQRGHPTLIRWHHVQRLRDFPADRGLNQYLREHAREVQLVSVESDSILSDLDTPADFERLVRRFG